MDVVEIDEVIKRQVQEHIKGQPEDKEPKKKKLKVPDKTIDPK